ncbi:MAG: hypothetical protein BWY85_02087 [Firmicutes bacterium ADurb.Bin506]|nr:MAG: hypothetical protein BWY85_02087 [Firmicutes bacterium ADurb.Bin506]
MVALNSEYLWASLLNTCTIRMPEMFSESDALMRASAARTLRYASRAFTRNSTVAMMMSGSVDTDTRARPGLSLNMTTTMPARVNTSLNRFTSTEVYTSFSVSVSLVSLVTSRPTGFLSKKARSMCSR